MEVISLKYGVFVLALLPLYYTIFKKHQPYFLGLVSVGFLGYVSWTALALLFLSSGITTLLARNKKGLALLGVVLHVVFFFLTKWNLDIHEIVGLEKGIVWIGFSYFSLQNIGLLKEHYLGNAKPVQFFKLILWNAYFPKLYSGPILMPNEMHWKAQVLKNPIRDNFNYGAQRILLGLFKKMVLASSLSKIVTVIFDTPTSISNGFTFCFGTILFTITMYLDFSAYTDIALGVSRLFGIRLKENFDLPLRSTSVSEYWRKTHMSLIHWLTQHIYYPIVYLLRKHRLISVLIAITLTFSLSGIWHELEWGYLIWGGLNALYLSIEFLGKKSSLKLSKFKPIGWLITILLISFANLFFRAGSWEKSTFILNKMIELPFLPNEWMPDFVAIIGQGGYLQQQFNLVSIAVLLIVFLFLEQRMEKWAKSTVYSITYFVVMSTLILLFGNFADGSEFIYMQF